MGQMSVSIFKDTSKFFIGVSCSIKVTLQTVLVDEYIRGKYGKNFNIVFVKSPRKCI